MDIVRYLVEERGAETEIPDNLGLTPGFCAVLQGREAVAEYLLSTNPEGVHARNMSSDTMLHCALKANAHKELVKLLLVNGADITAVGADNMSAEKMLIARGHSDLIASARRASIAEEGEHDGVAAARSRPQGPTQIPWLKKVANTSLFPLCLYASLASCALRRSPLHHKSRLLHALTLHPRFFLTMIIFIRSSSDHSPLGLDPSVHIHIHRHGQQVSEQADFQRQQVGRRVGEPSDISSLGS